MKKLSILLMLCLCMAATAQAQFRFGVKAGVDINKLKLDNTALSSDNRCGFTGGVMTEFQVPIIGLCLDASLMYARMASNPLDVTSTAEVSTAKNFLDIPINIKYKFQIPAVAALVKPYLFTGPDFAFKLGGKDDVFKTKTFQCGWNVGIGVELIRHLQLQGGYCFGLNNVFDSYLNTTSDIKLKNNYWTITAAYLF